MNFYKSFASVLPTTRRYLASISVLMAYLPLSLGHAAAKPESHTVLIGQWIQDIDGQTMLNPQTSGLKYVDGYLYTMSDGSSDSTQQKRLHKLDITSASVLDKYGPTTFSDAVQQSCFYTYLADKPDYEALVALDDTASSWIYVTEDARNGVQLSAECQAQYADTHSTVYPTLLVKLSLIHSQFVVEALRPIQFPKSANVGDAANDGIEGLSLTKDGRLLLGLEKDAEDQPRVFSVKIDEQFWDSQDFVEVHNAGLLMPTFESGRHPINGMDVYYPNAKSEGFLLAAARNDNELWVIDLAAKRPTKIIPLLFLAPSLHLNSQDYCAPLHEMDNASIEGVAVMNDTLFMVNDPWKVNYHKNIVCEADRDRYERFSPLLFSMPIKSEWFE